MECPRGWISLRFREILQPSTLGSGLVRDLEQPLPPPHTIKGIKGSSSSSVSATVALVGVSDCSSYLNGRGAKVLLLTKKKICNLCLSFLNTQNKYVPRITSSYSVPDGSKKEIIREQRVLWQLASNAQYSYGYAIFFFQ